MMGTAPRSPIQPMKSRSRQLKRRKGSRQRYTTTGRATKARKSASRTLGTVYMER